MNDIVQKLDNWAKYSTAGQKSVLIEARDEIERLREALTFYADKQNYEDRLYGQWPKVRDDEGGIARAALKGDE